MIRCCGQAITLVFTLLATVLARVMLLVVGIVWLCTPGAVMVLALYGLVIGVWHLGLYWPDIVLMAGAALWVEGVFWATLVSYRPDVAKDKTMAADAWRAAYWKASFEIVELLTAFCTGWGLVALMSRHL